MFEVIRISVMGSSVAPMPISPSSGTSRSTTGRISVEAVSCRGALK